MDYMSQMLRLHRKGPNGMDVYNISCNGGMIIVENGMMGGRTHRQVSPLSEKPRVDRLVNSLVERGYAQFEKTFGPWSEVRTADIQREIIQSTRKAKADKMVKKWGQAY